MAKNIKLLLTESVDALGIVGDVVNVRTGYARNYLLPRNLATSPSEEAIKAVAAKRADAERRLAELRSEREALIKKLAGTEITIQRSCNDLGHLYASVTQQEIAVALEAAGFPGVKARDVRLGQNIKRIDSYEVPIKFESDLEGSIKLWVVADRKLDLDRIREAEAEAEAAAKAAAAAAPEGATVVAAPAEAKPDKKADRKAEREPKSEKAPKADKPKKAKPEKSEDKPAATAPDKSGWGKKPEAPMDLASLGIGRRPKRSRD